MSKFRVATEMLIVAGIASLIILVLSAVSGCAVARNAGLLQMSDEWCAAHPEATTDRCSVGSAIRNAEAKAQSYYLVVKITVDGKLYNYVPLDMPGYANKGACIVAAIKLGTPGGWGGQWGGLSGGHNVQNQLDCLAK